MAKKPGELSEKAQKIHIKPLNQKKMTLTIVGDAPFVQHKFGIKIKEQMKATQEAGQQAKKGGLREPKDFEANYEAAKHFSTENWIGIPASAFRAACVDVCRAVGFHMTKAKMSIFVQADGYDAETGEPLVKITKGEPTMHMGYARNANGGVDLRARPMWAPGWEADVTITWDADQFSAEEAANLLARAGQQVGVGEGRPFSKNSAGCGWGTFTVKASP